jgi:NADPH oxidase
MDAFYKEYAKELGVGRSSSNASSLSGKERSRWPPLTRMLMSGEVTDEPWREVTWKEKFDVWMINEGYRRAFVVVFILLHCMVFAFGFMNYFLKVLLCHDEATGYVSC